MVLLCYIADNKNATYSELVTARRDGFSQVRVNAILRGSTTQSKTSVTVTLQLTEEERRWLHNVMQNPLYGCCLTEEEPEDSEMRHKFFDHTRNLD